MYDNYNYPPGSDTPEAPWNQEDVPEKDFDITCSQSLSRTATVTTNNYIPGASGVDYERDDEGGCSACSWQDPDDFSNTNWRKEYDACGYMTPIQLIQIFKKYCEKELDFLERFGSNQTPALNKEIKKWKHLIEECDCWNEDETEFIED